jgi:hypothetical protein
MKCMHLFSLSKTTQKAPRCKSGAGTCQTCWSCRTQACLWLLRMQNIEIAYTNNLYCAKIHVTSQGCITTSARYHTPCFCIHKHTNMQEVRARVIACRYSRMHHPCLWLRYFQVCRCLIHAYIHNTYDHTRTQDMWYWQLTGTCLTLPYACNQYDYAHAQDKWC